MKIALITGASSGIGTEYVNAVVEKYDSLDEIWIVARRKEKLEMIAEKYKEIHIVPVALDLAVDESYQILEQQLREKNAEIQVLINNAGFERVGRLDEQKKEDILSMINLNVKGLTMIDRIAFSFMIEGGIVIHTCSISSFAPVPSQAVYSATKVYGRYLSRALREEMKKKKVNVLMMCPGNMDTEMNPKGGNSQSKSVDKLPFLNQSVITRKSIMKAQNGTAIYTPGAFYKFYRLFSKVLPSAWMVKITGKSYPY